MHESPLLPETGFVRLDTILKLLPIGRSTFWAGVRTGRFPAPVKFGHRTSAWRVADIRALLERLSQDEAV
jgi:predicted DNA-binding transcriptional regulator AlpA